MPVNKNKNTQKTKHNVEISINFLKCIWIFHPEMPLPGIDFSYTCKNEPRYMHKKYIYVWCPAMKKNEQICGGSHAMIYKIHKQAF